MMLLYCERETGHHLHLTITTTHHFIPTTIGRYSTLGLFSHHNQQMKKNTKKNKKQSQSNNTEELLAVDPARIRYQHSRIRAHFSGCGRSVISTLESIQSGQCSVDDLPPIQVLQGPDQWYFTLNNRRLWVLKQLRHGGYLEHRNPPNTVLVRVREPKSKSEKERVSTSLILVVLFVCLVADTDHIVICLTTTRNNATTHITLLYFVIQYTLENCSVDAKFMREKTKNDDQDDLPKVERNERRMKAESGTEDQSKCSSKETEKETEDVEVSESESESDKEATHTNPFSALM